eukprot:725420-Hanusia_phi.AAC.1
MRRGRLREAARMRKMKWMQRTRTKKTSYGSAYDPYHPDVVALLTHRVYPYVPSCGARAQASVGREVVSRHAPRAWSACGRWRQKLYVSLAAGRTPAAEVVIHAGLT